MLAAVLALAVAVVPQDWYTFEPEGKNFRVALPGKPDSPSSRTVTGAAGPSPVTSAQVKTAHATYSIQLTEKSARINPNTLDDGIAYFAAANQAKLDTVTPITVGGNPGREFSMTAPAGEGETRSKSRWVAAGSSLFILTVATTPGGKHTADADRFLGSLEIGGVRATATPTQDSSSAKPYAVENLQDLPKSFVAAQRDGFRDVGPAGSVLVGVRVSYVDKFGGLKIGSVQPIYRAGKTHYLGRVYGQLIGPFGTFLAAEGYAVGGLVTHTGLMVDGFGMVLMKVNGNRLDPAHTYNSPWIGDRNGGGPGQVMSRGELVVGLQGRAEQEVRALGLTTLR